MVGGVLWGMGAAMAAPYVRTAAGVGLAEATPGGFAQLEIGVNYPTGPVVRGQRLKFEAGGSVRQAGFGTTEASTVLAARFGVLGHAALPGVRIGSERLGGLVGGVQVGYGLTSLSQERADTLIEGVASVGVVGYGRSRGSIGVLAQAGLSRITRNDVEPFAAPVAEQGLWVGLALDFNVGSAGSWTRPPWPREAEVSVGGASVALGYGVSVAISACERRQTVQCAYTFTALEPVAVTVATGSGYDPVVRVDGVERRPYAYGFEETPNPASRPLRLALEPGRPLPFVVEVRDDTGQASTVGATLTFLVHPGSNPRGQRYYTEVVTFPPVAVR